MKIASLVLVLLPGSSSALNLGLHAPARSMAQVSSSQGLSDRRAFLSSISALSLLFTPLSSSAAKDKGYLTLDEYNKVKAQEKADEQLYGKFETIRTRGMQTTEFKTLAQNDDLAGVSKLALAWDSSIRKELVEKTTAALDEKDKGRGGQLNMAILKDLKRLDKMAKTGAKDQIGEAVEQLKDHVLEYADLAPQRLQDKYGVSDL